MTMGWCKDLDWLLMIWPQTSSRRPCRGGIRRPVPIRGSPGGSPSSPSSIATFDATASSDCLPLCLSSFLPSFLPSFFPSFLSFYPSIFIVLLSLPPPSLPSTFSRHCYIYKATWMWIILNLSVSFLDHCFWFSFHRFLLCPWRLIFNLPPSLPPSLLLPPCLSISISRSLSSIN